MGLENKQQFLQKIEAVEGTDAAPGASDAILVFEPSVSDQVDIEDRRPAGGSLSRAMEPVGRNDRTFEFKSDFRGSEDTSIPVNAPEFGAGLEAAGYKLATLKKVTLGAVTLGPGFQVGEMVRQSSSIRGVVVGAFNSSGDLVAQMDDTGGFIVIAVIEGTWTAAATTGDSSLSSATASAVADYEGIGYQVNSNKEQNVTCAAWSSGDPAVGEVLGVYSETGVGGQRTGDVMVLSDNGSSMTDIEVALLWGTMAAGTSELRNAARTSVSIVATTSQTKGKSVTIRRNKDGRRKSLLGARATFSLAGDVGKPMQFTWTYTGNPGPTVNTPLLQTGDLGTISPPRLLGAFVLYGIGVDQAALPTKSVSLTMNQSPNPNLDANSAGGATGSNITERDPVIAVQIDDTSGGFDLEAARDNATPVRFAALLGKTPGNILGIIAPVCQAKTASEADAEGIAALDIDLHPRQINASGDDELYIVQL